MNSLYILKKIHKTVHLFYQEIEQLRKTYISSSLKNKLKKTYDIYYRQIKHSILLSIFFFRFLKFYKKLDEHVTLYNNQFLIYQNKNCKEFFDNIGGYPLDQNQRNAVLIDDDKNLIIAGAGSGKSLTMIGKIHYLIEKLNISEQDILCISFTNETTASLKNKLYQLYNYHIDVYTFHKLGYQIIKNEKHNYRIVPNSVLKEVVDTYFKTLDKNEIKWIINYFTELVKLPKTYQAKSKYQTLKSIFEKKEESVNGKDEVEIANILYMKGINYTYQKTTFGCKFILPKCELYYYHFRNPSYALQCIEQNSGKINVYVYDFYDKGILTTLESIITSRQIQSFPLDFEKLYQDMIYNQNDYLVSLKNLLINFMNIYKSGTKTLEDIEALVKPQTLEYCFIHIFKEIYITYQKKLDSKNQIDINDLLLVATKLTSENYHFKPYKYILIDEFQDTSLIRYQLIHNIIKHTHAKLVAVGDDFQSIYRFSGCDIQLFTNFSTGLKDVKVSYIEKTYRNSQELIDIAGSFVMKNPNQVRKKLCSIKHVENPIEIHYYSDLSTEISHLLRALSTGKNKIILGRNNKDIKLLESEEFNVGQNFVYHKKTKEKIPYLTVHKSKGLEFDYVFLINMIDDYTGFPSKIEEHDILKLVLPKEEEYPYAEERRLFYVALTRAKEKVFVLAPKDKTSIFVKELEQLLKKGRNM